MFLLPARSPNWISLLHGLLSSWLSNDYRWTLLFEKPSLLTIIHIYQIFMASIILLLWAFSNICVTFLVCRPKTLIFLSIEPDTTYFKSEVIQTALTAPLYQMKVTYSKVIILYRYEHDRNSRSIVELLGNEFWSNDRIHRLQQNFSQQLVR